MVAMPFSMPSFGQALAGNIGNSMLAGQQYEQQQLQIGMQKLQMQAMQEQIQAKQQQDAVRSAVAADLAQSLKNSVGGAVDAGQMAAKLQAEATKLAAAGDWQGMNELQSQANSYLKQAELAKQTAANDLKTKHEVVASAASDYLAAPSPEAANSLEKSYLETGGDPRRIPPRGTPEYSAWAQSTSMSSMNAADRAKFVQQQAEKQAEFKQKEADRAADRDFKLQMHRDSIGTQMALAKLRMTPTAAPVDQTTMDAMAAEVAAGRKLTEVVPGYGKEASAKRMEVQKAAVRQIMQENPDLTARQAGQLLAQREMDRAASRSGAMAYERVAGQTGAKVAIAAGEAVKMASLVTELAPQIGTTQYPTWNKLANAVKRGTGDPKIVALDQAMDSFVNEYARAIYGTGGGSVTDREHSRERLNAALANGQVDSVVGVMKREMELAQQATRGERGRGSASAQSQPATSLPAGWH